MKNLKYLIIIALVFSWFADLNAQIGIAVAKDENNSSVYWQVQWGNYSGSWEAERAAKEKLKGMGYEKITTLSGGDCCGHNLKGGYWVVVEATHKIYDGTMKTSYGLGASSSSYSEAETLAIKNLSTYDWSWSKSHGYSVTRKGTY